MPLHQPVSNHRYEDPTAVGVGDVVEAEKLLRTPPNPRAQAVVRCRLFSPPVVYVAGHSEKKPIAGFLVWEADGGPRTPTAGRVAQGDLLPVGRFDSTVPLAPFARTSVHLASRDLFLAQRFAQHVSPPSTVVYPYPSDQGMAGRVRGLDC
jgi:hypothetical protein